MRCSHLLDSLEKLTLAKIDLKMYAHCFPEVVYLYNAQSLSLF